MTDRELLERAAEVMGFANFSYASPESGICVELGCRPGAITSYWKPLTDDGDALRLAVKLGMGILVDHISSRAGANVGDGDYFTELFDTDPYAATRRAIVRAAAELKP